VRTRLEKCQKRAAWMVEWHCPPHDSRIKEHELRPHILPCRWKDGRVFAYMRCLFWNSALFSPGATLHGVNKPDSRGKDQNSGYMIHDGARLFYGLHGDACRLIAGFTKNLCITRGKSGQFVVKWTRPAGVRRDDTSGLIVPCGSSVERQWIWKAGRWFCNSELCAELPSLPAK